MPFTGSHPAAVLPFMRLGLPASALVIGSLAPDLPYYLPTPFTAVATHTPAAVLGANLLLGLAAFLLWHLLLVPPLIWVAPAGLQRRIPDRLRGGLTSRLATGGDLGRVCLAQIIGASTHLAWDAFTHAEMWGPRNLPWLNTGILALPLYRWLQFASSLVGLAIIGWAATRWWRNAPSDGPAAPVHPGLRWGFAVVMVGWAGLATAREVLPHALAPGPASRQALLIETLLTFFSTQTILLVGAAAAWHLLRSLRGARAAA